MAAYEDRNAILLGSYASLAVRGLKPILRCYSKVAPKQIGFGGLHLSTDVNRFRRVLSSKLAR